MDRALYDAYARYEDCHWWFVARRAILQRILERFFPGGDKRRILEIGCGTGGNLALLARHGRLEAIELDEPSRQWANRRGVCPVQAGALPHGLPSADGYDLICLLDVLEHIEDDAGVLRELTGRLVGAGSFLITVPAYRFLWSAHDEANHHRRRYNRRQLLELARQAGLRVRYITYYNTLLFPAIAASRLIANWLGRQAQSDLRLPAPALNAWLGRLFAGERLVMPRFALPFGVSLLMVAHKS